MVEKCANPNCESQLTYFRRGKLYVFDPRAHSAKSEWQATRLQHYWLCAACSAEMEIVVDGNGVALRRRIPAGSAAA